MRIFAIIITLCIGVALDLGIKSFIETKVFGEYQTICQNPLQNSSATNEYCLQNTLTLVPDILSIQLAYNEGIAFSLPIKGIILKIITLIGLIGIAWHYITIEYRKHSLLLDSAYICILAGALSHAYERIFIGHVVDFIAVKYFAILNFADIFISLGVLFFIIAYVNTGRTR